MDANVIAETTVIGVLGIAAIEPVTRSALAIADRVAKARAARGKALADILRDLPLPAPSTPPRPSITQFSAGAADEGPAPAVPASRRAGPVLAAKSAHPDWSWAQIGESTGMSGPAARGVFRRSLAVQNGARA